MRSYSNLSFDKINTDTIKQLVVINEKQLIPSYTVNYAALQT